VLQQFPCSSVLVKANCHVSRFIYGGYDNTDYSNINTPSDFTVLGDIWVLSLPGFKWFQATVEGPPRWVHACAVVGNRQMISVGGVSAYANAWTTNNPPVDPWAQGLGVLDLSLLSWSAQYDPTAAAYTSPDMVQAFYNDGFVDHIPFFVSNTDHFKAV